MPLSAEAPRQRRPPTRTRSAFTAPLIYTPGDNEWTDCHRANAGGYDPLDRLAFIRTTRLVARANEFGRPVLILYGDSHTYGMDRPFKSRAPNVTAVQVFGARDMHAVEVMIDPEDPAVFAFRPIYSPDIPIKPGQ